MSSPTKDEGQGAGLATQAQSTAAAAAQKVADTADAAAQGALNVASDAAQATSDAAASARDTVASGAASALGSTAEQAERQDIAGEVDHSKVPKAHENDVPDRIMEHPHLGDAPKVAEGDEERPVEPEIQDLGWSEDPHIPQPVIHGMTNEDFWVLVRR